jgi:F-type H+-transporting ATPase subunit delta
MAELATIARPYAEALFEVAKADNGGANLSAWSQLVQELARVARLPEVLSVASSPKVGHEQVVELLLSAVTAPAGQQAAAQNFVRMLVEKRRLALLPEIAAQFEALKNADEGAADATIESAFPLNPQQMADLLAKFEGRFRRKLKPTVKVEPSLIGGVRVTVGDEVLDSSVRARLAAMQTALTA